MWSQADKFSVACVVTKPWINGIIGGGAGVGVIPKFVSVTIRGRDKGCVSHYNYDKCQYSFRGGGELVKNIYTNGFDVIRPKPIVAIRQQIK